MNVTDTVCTEPRCPVPGVHLDDDERHDAVASLAGPDDADVLALFPDEPPPAPNGPSPIVVGRSELEPWATCAHQGALLAAGFAKAGGTDCDVGNAVHGILSEAVKARAVGDTAAYLRDLIEQRALKSRPDIQPQVVASLARRWSLVEMLCVREDGGVRSPDDLLRYDGGEGARSGQITYTIIPGDGTTPDVRLTCELDLLTATASRYCVKVTDYKSGWKHWTPTLVKQSFQFQFYAVVVMTVYPDVQTVEVAVWNTREGRGTDAVAFTRADFVQMHERLKTAVDIYLENRGKPVEDVEAWPAVEKCGICDAVLACRQHHMPLVDAVADPLKGLEQLIPAEALVARLKGMLTDVRRKRGEDLVYGEGKGAIAFGTGKPKKSRAPTCETYTLGGSARADGDD